MLQPICKHISTTKNRTHKHTHQYLRIMKHDHMFHECKSNVSYFHLRFNTNTTHSASCMYTSPLVSAVEYIQILHMCMHLYVYISHRIYMQTQKHPHTKARLECCNPHTYARMKCYDKYTHKQTRVCLLRISYLCLQSSKPMQIRVLIGLQPIYTYPNTHVVW